MLVTCIASCEPAVAADFADVDYRLGEGLHFPGLGLNVGGYATGAYERPNGSKSRFALDDLSLSIWWEDNGPWKVLAEFDSERGIALQSSRNEDDRRYLALERFYVDYALDARATLRVGKFLTPIGRWNQIHASPLVWTTSRPLVTTNAFPTNTTGLMLTGTVPVSALGLEYSIYGSTGDEVRANPALDTFSEAIGTHVSFSPFANARIGVSYVNFEQATSLDERKQLVGLDIVWSRNRFELTAEGVYRLSSKGSGKDERGAFVQGVAPLSGKLYAVARYELYRPAGASDNTQLWVAGVNYRATPAIVLKVELAGARHNTPGVPTGLLSSISLLF